MPSTPADPRRRVLLYGGSFDPPHLGHVMAATWALALEHFDEVRLVPAFGHPFGKRLTPFSLRCSMASAAVAHLGPRVRVEPIEGELPAPSYTIDTVSALAEREPDVAWTLMMGADAWADRRKWKAWDALAARASTVVVGRAGEPDPDGVSAETKLPDVSSTEVRRRVAAGEPFDALVPAAVAAMIHRHGLYLPAAEDGAGARRWGVIGRGRAARSLVPMLGGRGDVVSWWWSRGDAGEPGDLPAVDAVLLAVPDGALEEAARALAGRPSAGREVWLHLSGSRPGSTVRVSAEVPAAAGCLHPLVALTGRPDAAQLAGASAGLDGDPDALRVAREVAETLGLVPRELAPGTKVLYHAAAVTAAGHTVALFSEAMALLERCGFAPDAAREALRPLTRGAIANLATATPASAITGPIARGDVATVVAHLAALDAVGDALATATYRLLARQALRLSAPTLPPAVVAALAARLGADDRPDPA